MIKARSGFLLAAAPAFALYWMTLCPDLYWYDAAEFVNDAVLNDIPHPPGYPLFNLLVGLFTRIPIGTLAFRANLFSAACAATGVGLFHLALRSMGAATPLALAGSWLLAVSKEYWALGTIVEVYSLEAALIAFCLWWIARLHSELEPPPDWPLALSMGTLLFHRPTTLFFLVPWAILLRSKIARPGRFATVVALAALPYLHTAWIFFFRPDLPGRSWSINYFDFPRSIETFLRICTGTLYASNVRLFPPLELAQEVSAYVLLVCSQLGIVLTGLAFFGLIRACQNRMGPLSGTLAALFSGNVLFFLHYNALEKNTMYLPSILALAALSILVLESSSSQPAPRRVAAGLVAVWAVVTGMQTYGEVDRSRYLETRRAVLATGLLLPPRAVLYLTDDLIIHPFLHLAMVEGRRRDVTLTIVDGFGPDVEKGLRERLAKGYSVFSPLFYPEELFLRIRRTYRLVPRGFLYEITPGPVPMLPRFSGRNDRWGTRVLVGSRIFPESRRMRRSDQLQVVLTWQGPVLGDPAVVFRWSGATGEPGALTWVFPIGYQGRPAAGGTVTEEYLLKIPWNLDPRVGGPGFLELTVVGSVKEAVSRGEMRLVKTKDWGRSQFFNGMTESFVRCIERGVGAYSEVFEWTGTAPVERQRWVGLGPVAVVGEEGS